MSQPGSIPEAETAQLRRPFALTPALFAAGLLILVAIKVFLAFVLELYSDEIFYWQASTRPALAYSDLPFMAALLAGSGASLFGPHPAAVRSLFLLLGSSLPFLIFWLARPLVPRRQALEAAGLTLCLPLGAALGVLAVPDVALIVFALLMLGCMERATRLDSTAWWIAGGAAAALGLSSHYRFVLMPLAALLFLALRPDQHYHWKRPGLWIGAAVMLTGLLPALSFRLGNELSALDYHLVSRHPWQFQAEGLLHILKQAALVTPPLYLALILTLLMLLKQLRGGDSRRALFGLFAATNLAVYAILAPWADTTRTSFHWPLSGYLPLLVFLPDTLRRIYHFLRNRRSPAFSRRATLLVPAFGFLGSLTVLAALGSQAFQESLRPLLGRETLSVKMAGWEPFTDRALQLLREQQLGQEAVLVTDNYYTAAQLEFALAGSSQPAPEVYTLDQDKAVRDGRYAQLHLWERGPAALSTLGSRRGMVVTEDSELTLPDRVAVLKRACSYFQDVEFLEKLELFQGTKTFSFYRATREPGSDSRQCDLPAHAWIDQPRPGQRAADQLVVSGWVYNESGGVAELRALLHGRVFPLQRRVSRQDVVSANHVEGDPGAPELGFEQSLDISDLPEGEAELLLEVISHSGERQTFRQRIVIER